MTSLAGTLSRQAAQARVLGLYVFDDICQRRLHIDHHLPTLGSKDSLPKVSTNGNHVELHAELLGGTPKPPPDRIARFLAREGDDRSRAPVVSLPFKQRQLEDVLADLLKLGTFQFALTRVRLDENGSIV